MANITRAGFLVIAVIGVVAVGVIGKYAVLPFLGKPTDVVAVVPEVTKIQHFTVPDTQASYPLPISAKPTQMPDCPVMEVLPWNAIGGISLANGGATTARDSLVQKYTGGGCLSIKRQDDYGQMEANMAKFVNSNGANGDAFFIIMGDGYPYVAAALQKLIPGQFAAFGVIGFSDGEDQCMVPSEAVKDKQKLRGTLIALVPLDGDFNVCVKLASDNGVPINVDQKTYDPTAMNFMNVGQFTDADDKLIGKACEDRQIVEKGIAHGTKKVCVNGVATWTPGDVDVVAKYDGSIMGAATTHDYAGQMPALIIGVKSWMASHHDYVVGLLKAADRGAMGVRSGPEGLMQMGGANAQIFKEQNAAYWARFYKGDVAKNRAGEDVHVGGSKVITLQEARDYFGLRPGTENIYSAVYRVFKGYDESFFPMDYPKTGNNSIPAYGDVVDISYMTDALQGIPETVGTVNASLAIPAPITQTVSTKSWHIEFDTGKDTIKAESMPQLFQIEDTASITALRLRLDGYTDATGSAAVNLPLSQARAEAVANWLFSKAPANFPHSRMEPRGHGSEAPVCAEATETCRAQNRRVEVTLGQ